MMDNLVIFAAMVGPLAVFMIVVSEVEMYIERRDIIGTWIITIRITQQHLCMLISELAAGVILFLALWRSAKR